MPRRGTSSVAVVVAARPRRLCGPAPWASPVRIPRTEQPSQVPDALYAEIDGRGCCDRGRERESVVCGRLQCGHDRFRGAAGACERGEGATCGSAPVQVRLAACRATLPATGPPHLWRGRWASIRPAPRRGLRAVRSAARRLGSRSTSRTMRGVARAIRSSSPDNTTSRVGSATSPPCRMCGSHARMVARCCTAPYRSAGSSPRVAKCETVSSGSGTWR